MKDTAEIALLRDLAKQWEGRYAELQRTLRGQGLGTSEYCRHLGKIDQLFLNLDDLNAAIRAIRAIKNPRPEFLTSLSHPPETPYCTPGSTLTCDTNRRIASMDATQVVIGLVGAGMGVAVTWLARGREATPDVLVLLRVASLLAEDQERIREVMGQVECGRQCNDACNECKSEFYVRLQRLVGVYADVQAARLKVAEELGERRKAA